jgi:hypothetical protein
MPEKVPNNEVIDGFETRFPEPKEGLEVAEIELVT